MLLSFWELVDKYLLVAFARDRIGVRDAGNLVLGLEEIPRHVSLVVSSSTVLC